MKDCQPGAIAPYDVCVLANQKLWHCDCLSFCKDKTHPFFYTVCQDEGLNQF